MQPWSSSPRQAFDRPASYRIWVLGAIASDWVDRLEGMTVRATEQAQHPPITILSGELADQAALMGVLTSLYEMHLALLQVECLTWKAETDRAAHLSG